MIRRCISDEGKIKAIRAVDIAAITGAINYNALQDDDIIITNINALQGPHGDVLSKVDALRGYESNH
jgi:hypothetical protein